MGAGVSQPQARPRTPIQVLPYNEMQGALQQSYSPTSPASAPLQATFSATVTSSVNGRRSTEILQTLVADPELRTRLEEYLERLKKESQNLEVAIDNAVSMRGKLVGLSLDSVQRLACLRNPIIHMGLYNEDEENILRFSLWDAAGRPNGKRAFSDSDRSTWCMRELEKLSMRDLAEIQCYAGPQYNCVVNMYVNIQKLDPHTTNNMVPFHENFFPVDKSSLRNLSSSLKFRLLDSAFESGTQLNSKEQLLELKNIIFGKESQQRGHRNTSETTGRSFELVSSPLNALTLPDAARAKAAIPIDAAFFSFCYPAVTKPIASKLLRESRSRINKDDPFVKWLTSGAFVYFDYKFDVVGINAVNFEELDPAEGFTVSSLCMGECSPLPLSAIQPLKEWARWAPVSEPLVIECFGFTHFAWITPSEFIGDHIFPPAGGFAYLHKNDVRWNEGEELVITGTKRSCFFPVTRNDDQVEHIKTTEEGRPVWVNKRDLLSLGYRVGVEITCKLAAQKASRMERPLLYNTPLHIDEPVTADDDTVEGLFSDKFVSTPEQAVFAAGASAAYGLPKVLGYTDESNLISSVARQFQINADARETMMQKETKAVTPALITVMLEKGAMWLRSDETPESFCRELQQNMEYVLLQKAKTEKVMGNNGVSSEKDTGHDGWSLDDFHNHPQSRMAQLSKAEVAALRLYTSSTFRVINGPLRANFTPHPLAATTLFISNALKKLRACHMDKKNFQTIYLWRGMRDRTVSEDFMLKGGSELACMSTSSDLKVVASYARSKLPLLFRLKVDSPMELGADLQWLSIFPGEAEVLYPPLTFAKPLFKQTIKGSETGIVVTIKPSFPS